MKTMEGWNRSKTTLSEYLNIGDVVDDKIYGYFFGVLPPATMTETRVQLGEPMRHDRNGNPMYMTLSKINKKWLYAGVLAGPRI